jgi:nucleolar GTP-binding protein
MRPEDLSPENRVFLDEIINQEGVKMVQASCYTDEGVMDVKNTACDILLAHRVESKLKGTKINSVINRIHVAQPKPRDDVVREPFIPDAVKERQKINQEGTERRKLERDIEAEEGGAGVYNINMKSKISIPESASCLIEPFGTENYFLADPEWKNDIIPEIMDGKNIADFIDPDILEKLDALEREEEKLEAEGFYESDEEIVSIPCIPVITVSDLAQIFAG